MDKKIKKLIAEVKRNSEALDIITEILLEKHLKAYYKKKGEE